MPLTEIQLPEASRAGKLPDAHAAFIAESERRVSAASIAGIGGLILLALVFLQVEGLPQPLDYLPELAKFNEAETLQIMRDNARALNTPQPA